MGEETSNKAVTTVVTPKESSTVDGTHDAGTTKDSVTAAVNKNNNDVNTEIDNNDNDIPAHVLKVKEKLERETGKKYKYRTPKKELPPISELLKYGVPPEQQKQKTGGESKEWYLNNPLYGPFGLLVLFVLSLFTFHNTVMQTKPTYVPYKVLQEQKRQMMQMQQQRQQQQQKEQDKNNGNEL